MRGSRLLDVGKLVLQPRDFVAERAALDDQRSSAFSPARLDAWQLPARWRCVELCASSVGGNQGATFTFERLAAIDDRRERVEHAAPAHAIAQRSRSICSRSTSKSRARDPVLGQVMPKVSNDRKPQLGSLVKRIFICFATTSIDVTTTLALIVDPVTEEVQTFGSALCASTTCPRPHDDRRVGAIARLGSGRQRIKRGCRRLQRYRVRRGQTARHRPLRQDDGVPRSIDVERQVENEIGVRQPLEWFR